VNTLYAIASVVISAGLIVIVYRAAAQIADIDDATERDLRESPQTPHPGRIHSGADDIHC
jgi:hypothetical protein